ncbi:hypothetical protein BVX98_04245 [bacterium F11]|nr:hypothetical protein BVX98_04245 [bacterium F11]
MIDLNLLDDILKLNLGVSQEGNKTTLDMLQSVVPFEIKRFPTGIEHNGWIIPHKWVVKKAVIRKNGKVLFDGMVHPMAVAGYSSPFNGTVSKKVLDQHLFFTKKFPKAYAYHCMNNYRPWAKHWGFCVPYDICRKWTSGNYQIDLDTDFIKDEMVVGELHHEGASPETLVFNAHTCHTCQANDGLAGVMVILELFKWLKGRKTNFSYRGVIGPEHIGTVFYINSLSPEDLARLKLGVFVEMIGSKTPWVLQKSFTGQSIIDKVSEYVLRKYQSKLKVGDFRTVVGNDETVWEAPGVEMPMVSISRWPYKEYHTSEDNVKIMSPDKINESLEVLKDMVMIFEQDRTIQRKFKGLIALSNPKYNLYIERPDPVVKKKIKLEDLRLGQLQDGLLRYFDGKRTIFEIAQIFNVPFNQLLDHLKKFEEKDLVDLAPVSSFERYR